MSQPLFANAKPAAPRTEVAGAIDLSGFQQVNVTPPVTATTALTVTNVMNRTKVTDELIDKLGQGSTSQVSQVSQKILAGTKASDVDLLGSKLNDLISTTKKLDPTKMGKPSFLGRIFGAANNVKEKLHAEYQTVETRMNALIGELDSMAKLMDQRVVDLEQMYKENEQLYANLEQEIVKGNALVAGMIDSLSEMPTPTNPLEAQQIADFEARKDRLEKRIDDLKRGQQLILISLPEIRMEQNNKRALSSGVSTVKTTTIPAWQGVFSRYIIAMESKKGAEIINSVYDATDAAFKQTADLMRANAGDIAKVQQRSVVSVETMIHCRDQLIGALDDVKRINDEGRAARAAARPQIEQLEQSLIARFTPAQLTQSI